jgi:hypothetical protein
MVPVDRGLHSVLAVQTREGLMTEETKEMLMLAIKTATSFMLVRTTIVVTVVAFQPPSRPAIAAIFGIVLAFIVGAIVWGL